MKKCILILVMWTSLIANSARAEICAKNFSDLDKTENLKSLKVIIPQEGKRGFVNKTSGSYFWLEVVGDSLEITFFTTGLLDLYGIRRQGKIEFCDTGKSIQARGIQRNVDLVLKGMHFQFGGGTARESFTAGPMPEALRRIHDVESPAENPSETPLKPSVAPAKLASELSP
ncbi:MAG: hypothetical protein K2Q26_10495 [Bdellovibrionales bacterium]|nr:hypothetical protein [Bdellovibrionales bacterium]